MRTPFQLKINFELILYCGALSLQCSYAIATEQFPQIRGGDYPAIIEKDGLCLQQLLDPPEGMYPVGRGRCREILCRRINTQREVYIPQGVDKATLIQGGILSLQSSIYEDSELLKNERPPSEIMKRYGRSCGDPLKYEAFYGSRWEGMR